MPCWWGKQHCVPPATSRTHAEKVPCSRLAFHDTHEWQYFVLTWRSRARPVVQSMHTKAPKREVKPRRIQVPSKVTVVTWAGSRSWCKFSARTSLAASRASYPWVEGRVVRVTPGSKVVLSFSTYAYHYYYEADKVAFFAQRTFLFPNWARFDGKYCSMLPVVIDANPAQSRSSCSSPWSQEHYFLRAGLCVVYMYL